MKHIELMYATYYDRLLQKSKKYTEDSDLAEDAVQSVFEKVLTYPEGFLNVSENEVFYFLSRILKNETFDLLRYEKNHEHECLVYEDGSEGDFIEDPSDRYMQMLDIDSLRRNLLKIEPRYRNIFLYRYVYGLKCKEIAFIRKISERTVKARSKEARDQLRKLLEEEL